MSFIHLHNHTEYSLLNGAIRIPAMIAKAKEMGMESVAITDYGNIFGAVDFYTEAKKKGLKPLIGAVVFHPSHDDHALRQHRRGVDHLYSLLLLIENETGYKNLCRLITRSYLDGFYYKPRIDSKLLKEYGEGLIALSAGLDGAAGQLLFEGKKDAARQKLKDYAELFPGRFYVELQENGIEGQHEINLNLLQMAKELGLPVVATNNCHYLAREEAEAFETLLCVQMGGTLHAAHQDVKFSTDGYFFKSPEEMASDFAYAPEALTTTAEIAERCQFDFDLKTYHFPKFDPPAGLTLDAYLAAEAHTGLQARWHEILKSRGEPETPALKALYDQRLERELGMIAQMGFSGYFLIVSDFIRYAKNNGVPVGPGRGSAAGSLVAYCVQITDLDPLPYNLLFERFLNPERISMPDVDIDFCMRHRERVLHYVAEKYGNVSQIITFGKMKARAVLRDVGRVLEVPLVDVDKIAKLVPTALDVTLESALAQEPRLKEMAESSPQLERLLEIARRLEGLNRHASTHAAGVVISDKPLTEFVPLYKGGNGDVVTQFDMKAIEKVGLIKFDFLGLKTLTVIHDALKIIKRTQGLDLNILDLPLKDEGVYAMLGKGDAAGVFQLESSGMKDLLVRMKPSCFEDLVAVLALYRPGPLGSGMVDDFINRKQGKTPIVYDLPQLQGILEDTYGVIVYQEQVMQISSALAGYSLGEADLLRRAMGKKKADEMASQKIRFLKGCEERKIPKPKADKIFDLMAKFAEYGFNKSHSAAYALVTFQTAYLKAHYTVEYLAAVLSSEMHDTDRIQYYIEDCKTHTISVLPPDVNESYTGFSVTGPQTIRYGLGALKNVGEGAIEAIVEARQEGPFTSFYQFCERVDHKRINKRVVESLIKSGAFDNLESNRALLMKVMEASIEHAVKRREEEGRGQTNLFGGLGQSSQKPAGLQTGEFNTWSENEKLSFEKEAVGFYLSGHPLKVFEAEIRRVSTHSTKNCQFLQRECSATIAGMFVTSRVITTKKGSRMAFATLEDLESQIEVILFSDTFQKHADLLSSEKPLVVKGSIDRIEEGVKLIAEAIIPLSEYLESGGVSVHLKIPVSEANQDRFARLTQILETYRGKSRCYLHMIDPGKAETVMELGAGVRLNESDVLIERVNKLFGGRVVEFGGKI